MAKTTKTTEKETIEVPKPQYYTVTVEAQATVTITYRILADSPQAALDQAAKPGLLSPQHPPTIQPNTLRKLSAKVYDYGSSLLRLNKKWV